MRTFHITKDGTGGKIHIHESNKEIACYYLTNFELDCLQRTLNETLT